MRRYLIMNGSDYSYFSGACLKYGDDVYLLEESRARHASRFFPLVEGREIRVDRIVFLVCYKGDIEMKLNHQVLQIGSSMALVLLPGMIIETLVVSEDLQVQTILLSKEYASGLNLNGAFRATLSIRRQPLLTLSQEVLEAFGNFYGMVCAMLRQGNHPNLDQVLHLLFEAAFYGIWPYLICVESQLVSVAAEMHTEYFLQLVEDHFREHHELDWYAEQLHVSTKRLCICVKDVTGRTAKDWIDQHLMFEATRMLQGGLLSVKETALYLGFSNQSAFGTWFRRKCGISPSRCRKLR